MGRNFHKSMTGMCLGVTGFNKDNSKLDVSFATTLGCVFSDTSVFNKNLSNWNVSRVNNVDSMLKNNKKLNYQLC